MGVSILDDTSAKSAKQKKKKKKVVHFENFNSQPGLKMRTIIRNFQQFQPAFQNQGDNILCGLARKQNYLAKKSSGSVHKFFYNAEICSHTHPSCMMSRAFFANAAGVTTRVSFIKQYSDGIVQVGTLTELQRLFDELVESAEACQLDRYAYPEKARRSSWFWSSFIPQSSYSSVKGLYLYGGVGTGKTMLMDLFLRQL